MNQEVLAGTMLNRGIRTRIHTGTTFNTFFDIFCDSLPVYHFKDLYRAGSDAFPCSFAFIVINSYGYVSFFEFLFHGRFSLL